MSLLTRLFNLVRNPIRYVGRDLEGNRFYEYPGTNSDRPKRTVQYKDPEDVWKYIGGGKRLPVQWSMWLTHTRPFPPALEELQQDLERQRRVLANVALIEAKDEEDRQARLLIEQGIKDDTAKRAQRDGLPEQPQPNIAESSTVVGNVKQEPEHTTQSTSTTSASEPKGSDGPQSWAPKALRRG